MSHLDLVIGIESCDKEHSLLETFNAMLIGMSLSFLMLILFFDMYFFML